jgi:hypothetical protein
MQEKSRNQRQLSKWQFSGTILNSAKGKIYLSQPGNPKRSQNSVKIRKKREADATNLKNEM